MGPNGSGKTTLAYALMGHPGLRRQGRRGPLEGPRHPQAVARQARPARPVPRLPVPDRDPRPERRELHPLGAQRQAPGHRQEPRHRPDRPDQGRHLDARLPQQDAREDGAAPDGRGLRRALRQRGLLGRREEAPRDAPDGRPRAGDGDPRRDRLRARHRRAADRRRGRQRDAQPEPRRPADHPLPAPAQLHHARTSSTSWPRAGSSSAAARTSRSASRTRATARSCARPASTTDLPDEALLVPQAPAGAELEAGGEPPARRAPPDDPHVRADGPSARPRSRAFDPHAFARRLPDPRPGDQRPPAGLPRLGLVEPEAARRHRRRRRLLPRVQRQRPSRHLHDRREGDRRLRGGPGQGRRGSSTRPTATRSSSPATRPRRSTSSPTRGAGGTSVAATRSS